jgi:hypothetical protein
MTDIRALEVSNDRIKNIAIAITQSHLNRNVIGLGYKAHIVHSCATGISDSMPIDMEVLVIQIFPYFHMRADRMEDLKYYCFFIGKECKQILSCVNMRRLSLLPA